MRIIFSSDNLHCKQKPRETQTQANSHNDLLTLQLIASKYRSLAGEGGHHHWGYREHTGPENWPKTCQDGFRQVRLLLRDKFKLSFISLIDFYSSSYSHLLLLITCSGTRDAFPNCVSDGVRPWQSRSRHEDSAHTAIHNQRALLTSVLLILIMPCYIGCISSITTTPVLSTSATMGIQLSLHLNSLGSRYMPDTYFDKSAQTS
ncbi:unnamed protein product [Strongylus vulgaris]|uniref:Uncharacterized protein n=1 Tax=Strongylus vulgaris TaxID=40348 RepID=A0A3P7ISI4_STRVU|nr:unnamed protein product [Strongylus vulgaris]